MAISTEITWSIDSVDRELSDGFIYQSHWTMTGVAKSDGVGIATATCSDLLQDLVQFVLLL